jgi:hypothetical protein
MSDFFILLTSLVEDERALKTLLYDWTATLLLRIIERHPNHNKRANLNSQVSA